MKPMVVVIEPTSSGTDLVDAAVRLGYGIIVVSYDADDRTLSPRTRELADEIVRVDTNDESALEQALREIIRRQPLKGILPGFEYYVAMTSRINARLGFPGISAQNSECVRNKHQMRVRCTEQGVRAPRFAHVTSKAELLEAMKTIGYPAVLKPDTGSGSIHVQRVDDQAQLLDAYRRIHEDGIHDLGRSFGASLLLEEYIRGPELSVEGYVSTAGVEIVAITQKLLGPEPNFVEMGHIVEGDVDAGTRRAIIAYVREFVLALGLNMGVFHCELRLSADGPVAIEIGARLAGDRICKLVELAKGISLPELMVRAYTGEALAPRPVESRGHAGISFFAAPPDVRVFHGCDGLDAVRQQVAGVEEVHLSAHPGDSIVPLTDFRGRLGHVLVTARTYQELLDKLATIKALITVRGERAAGAA